MRHLLEITKRNLQRIDDKQIKNIHKSNVTDLLEILVKCHQYLDNKKEVLLWSLVAELNLCLKMIKSPFFDKKLRGINGLVEMLEKKKSTLPEQLLLKWAKQNKLFQTLFTENDNPELMKKGAQFARHLHLSQNLPKETIFLIWNARIGKHETALQEIYSFASGLPLRTKDEAMKIQFFEKIAEVPKQQWDEDYIKLIKQYTSNAIGWISANQKVGYLYGFSILYQNLILKKDQASLTYLVQILDRFDKTDFLGIFTLQCFNRVYVGDESQTHILLLLRMAKEQILSVKATADVDPVDVLVTDLLRKENLNSKRLADKFDLLSEMLKSCEQCVTFQSFEALWNTYIDSPGRKDFLNWVYKRNNGIKIIMNSHIQSDVRVEIFDKLWDIEDDQKFANMQEDQATVLIEYFKSANIIKGKIKKINFVIKAESMDLIGFNKIEKLFNLCKDKNLAQQLANLIVSLHMSPGKTIKESKEQMISILMDKIIKNLTVSLKNKDYWAINKQLLLTSKAIAREQQILDIGNTVPRFFAFKDYTVVCRARQEQKVIRFNFGGLFYDFKKLVAQKFRIPIKACKIFHKGQHIKQDYYYKAMNECSFTGSVFEMIELRDQPSPVKVALSDRLENFFDLLGYSEVQKQAWHIVSQLPLSKKAKQTVFDSKYPWAEITNDSLYRQLYMFKIINVMNEKWWKRFIEQGGLNFLVAKLNRVQSKSEIEIQYLQYLTTILSNGLSLKPSNQKIPENCFIACLKRLELMLQNIQNEEYKNQNTYNQIKIIRNVFTIGEKTASNQAPLDCIVRDLPSSEQFLKLGLILVKQPVFRKEFLAKLQTLNQFSQQTINFVLEALLHKMFQFVAKFPQQKQLNQYFEYTSQFMTKVGTKAIKNYVNSKNITLVSNIFRLIKQEKHQTNIDSTNYLLCGFLKLLKHLIELSSAQQKERVSQYIISQCLFAESHAKCQGKESRFAALELLRVILRESTIQNKIISFFGQLNKNGEWRTRKYDDWTIAQTDKQKSSTGYVGIKNLGCTCYMNSFFQQIFMIPEFRNGILECEDPFYNPNDQGQNMLFQLKIMFMNLSYSSKRFYHPKQFCVAFKDYQGNPTNTSQQMDIDEFSGILFDRIQNQIKGTKHQSIVKDLFGGVFANQIICKGCPHFSENEEHFLSVPLTVKNKKDIYQSFDTMIKGDNLDGENAFFCQRCNKKVSAVKRACLKKLPDYLILALKRFEFDFETMTKLKINEYYEFPTEINLKNYSQQYLRNKQKPNSVEQDDLLPDQYYEYALKGVVIHLGYADSGHYYSFIQQRNGNGHWLDFNDTVVRPFDSKRLGQQAFGGQVGHIDVKEKIKNAYLLIYDRKKKQNQYFRNLQSQGQRDFLSSPAYVQIRKNLLMENRVQKIQNLFFSSEYYKFMENLLGDIPLHQEKQTKQLLKFAVLVYLTITVRQKDQNPAFSYLKKLQPLLEKSKETCEWILTVFSFSHILDQFFKDDPIREIKKLISNWLSHLTTFCSIDVVKLFVHALLRYMVANNENSTDICMIIFNLMTWNEEICDYIVKCGVIGRMMENLIRREPRKYSSIDDLPIPKESPQFDIGKAIVIQRTAYELSRRPKPDTDNGYVWAIIVQAIQMCQKRNIELSSYITETQFGYLKIPVVKIYKILEQSRNKFQIKKFVRFLCYLSKDDDSFSQQMMNLVFKGLKQFESKRYRQFFILFKNLININDEFKKKRIIEFRKVIKALQENQKYPLDADIIQQWMIKTLRKSAELRSYLKQDLQAIQYLARLATKKIPSQQLARKHVIYSENMVNKLHGIKILRTKRGYLELARQKEQFFLNLRFQEPQIQHEQWDSDDDITEADVKPGDTIAYFNPKDVLEFCESKVDEVFLNRIYLTPKRSKNVSIWKDDQKLTSMHKIFEQDLNHPNSDKTTQMDPDQQAELSDP